MARSVRASERRVLAGAGGRGEEQGGAEQPASATPLQEALQVLRIDEDSGVRSGGAEPAGAAIGAAQPAASQHASRWMVRASKNLLGRGWKHAHRKK